MFENLRLAGAMAIITLTSDFGLVDGYVGIMKGVILSIAPESRLIDLSHDLQPQAVRQAAFVLSRAVPFFPVGAVHLAVVDPGVGTSRRPLLVITPNAKFVGPDNGLFTFALDGPDAQAWLLNKPEYWLPQVSRSFHGRDIFAPVAAHLSAGVAPDRLASPLLDPVRLSHLAPVREANGDITGQVVYVDRFGNLLTNIPAGWLGGRRWECEIGGMRIAGPSDSYGAAPEDSLLLLISSSGTVEIAVRNGSAFKRLALGEGAEIHLLPI
jgi:S-adenosyl-L-methionine hydrolase (adenosine-forming)